MLLKMGALTPWLQPGPDRLAVKQRSQIVRRIYDLGRVVKLLFRKIIGSLTHLLVNDPTALAL